MSFGICPCFYKACQSFESCLIRIYVFILRSREQCQALRACICAAVTINTLTISCKSTLVHRDWHDTHTNTQTHPVACSHFCPLCCPSRRQWWLFSKLTPPTKACDHLSCQRASVETTNQPTVWLALKLSPQKMCHLLSFRTQPAFFFFFPRWLWLIFVWRNVSAEKLSNSFVWMALPCNLWEHLESPCQLVVN